jgi:NADPH2:quinone reductase
MKQNKPYPDLMKAVILKKQGEPLSVSEVNVPEPGPGEVVIKMAAAPINPSDIARIKRAYPESELATIIPGLEGSGRVVAAGKGLLPRIWLGRRVTCSSKHLTSGSWAEYMVTSAGMCFPLSKKVSDEQGSMSLVNPLTVLVFFDIVRKNKHKAIINNAAASALGRMMELLGKKKGIPVINLVRNQNQAEILMNSGSEHVLVTSSSSFLNKLKDLAGDLKATILFDSVCSRQTRDIIDVLPYGSEVIIYGNLSGEEEIMVKPMNLISNDIHISGFYLGNSTGERGLIRNILDLNQVRRLMKNDLKINIRNKYPLDKVNEAIESYVTKMSSGKVLLVPGLLSDY